MMIQRQYHYFISGLPNISFEDKKAWTSMASFKKILEDHLHPDDFEQAKYIFLKEDHDNLISFIEKGETDPERNGNFTIDDFKEQVNLFYAILPAEDILPPYMVRVLKENEEHREREEKMDPVRCSHLLAEGYYDFIMEHGSPFLKAYTGFEYDLANLITYIKTERHGYDKGRFLSGASEHVRHLRQYLKKTLAKDPEFEFFDEIMSYAGIQTFEEQEIKFDQLKWRVIDEMIFFEEFTIDWILGYLEQMLIVSRWASLKKGPGEEKLREMIDNVRKEAIRERERADQEER